MDESRPTKEWPNYTEIVEIVEDIMLDWVLVQGKEPADLKLRSTLEKFKDYGFTGNFMVIYLSLKTLLKNKYEINFNFYPINFRAVQRT